MGMSPTNTTCIFNHTRPRNEQELFNLRHSSLCNIIKHIFGVLKRQWHILDSPPEYNMHIQARVPAALCAVHNFIQHFDADTFNDLEVDWDYMWFIEDGELPPDAGNEDLVQEEQAGGMQLSNVMPLHRLCGRITFLNLLDGDTVPQRDFIRT